MVEHAAFRARHAVVMSRRSSKAVQKELFSRESAQQLPEELPWDGEALTNLLGLVRRYGDRAYHGTDRMTTAEQQAWERDVGPVLRIREIDSMLATSPRCWPDYRAWLRSYSATARQRAAEGILA